jgi:lipopolysaccharide transport system ATP-binding protein
MMAKLSLDIHGIGKRFFIAGQNLPYHTLRDSVMQSVTSPMRRIGRLLRGQTISTDAHLREFWALRDISFRVQEGEVVGIIGHNGAGKSTLLKILSSITAPTEGYAHIYGRVGSLLEVGTGFHQELTGRENIFLNGSILGMTRAEIRQKFDEIVAFAGVEAFIDTPLKFYSTGMGLRLGFSVAAHLEPEILIVDEVLAVGDAEFQKKSLNKMGEVSRQGRTVLFVSHNLAAIENLCSRAMLLEHGALVMDGDTLDVLNHYRSVLVSPVQIPLADREDRAGNGVVRFTNFTAHSATNIQNVGLVSGQDAVFRLGFQRTTSGTLHKVQFNIIFFDQLGNRLFHCSTRYMNKDFSALPALGSVECRVPHLPLAAGSYLIDINVHVQDNRADIVPRAAIIVVHEGDFYGTGRLPVLRHSGFVLVGQDWQLVE